MSGIPGRKALVRAVMTKNAAGRGAELVGQLGTAVSKGYRTWSSPQAALRRKVQAARRRRGLWGAGAAGSGAFTAYQVVTAVNTGVTAWVIATGLLAVVILVWCLAGVVRAVTDLRQRRRMLQTLPPAPPDRVIGAGKSRKEIDRLDAYSDALRSLVTMIGLDAGSAGTQDLRGDIVAAADAAELHIRRQAADYGRIRQMLDTAPVDARPTLQATADLLLDHVRAGVSDYGDLVTAAGETVGAGHALRTARPELTESADRLQALALGMRELAERPDR